MTLSFYLRPNTDPLTKHEMLSYDTAYPSRHNDFVCNTSSQSNNIVLRPESYLFLFHTYPRYKLVYLHSNIHSNIHHPSTSYHPSTINILYTITISTPITSINIMLSINMSSMAFSDIKEFGNGPVYFAHCIACVLTICFDVAFILTFIDGQVRDGQVRLTKSNIPLDDITEELVTLGIIIQSPLIYLVLLIPLSLIFLLANGIYYYFN